MVLQPCLISASMQAMGEGLVGSPLYDSVRGEGLNCILTFRQTIRVDCVAGI